MATTKPNTLGIMYIPIGSFPYNTTMDRLQPIQADISRLSTQIPNINNIEIIASKPNQSHKIHWTLQEVLKELRHLRITIGRGTYGAYLVIVISHGNFYGNHKSIIASDGQKIKYLTIQNSIRNAKDIQPIYQRTHRMCLIYSCSGPSKSLRSTNHNQNAPIFHHMEGNNSEVFSTPEWDNFSEFHPNWTADQLSPGFLLPDTNVHMCIPSLSPYAVNAYETGNPPITSLLHFIHNNIGKKVDFFTGWKQQVVNDMADFHEFYENNNKLIDPQSLNCKTSSPPPIFTFTYKNQWNNAQKSEIDKLNQIFIGINNKKQIYNRNQMATATFVNITINKYITDFSIIKTFQQLGHYQREVSLIAFVNHFQDSNHFNPWITIDNVRLIKKEIEINLIICFQDKPAKYNNNSIHGVIFQPLYKIISKLKQLTNYQFVRTLVECRKLQFMPYSLDKIIDYESDNQSICYKILHDFETTHAEDDILLLLCPIESGNEFCGFVEAQCTDDGGLVFRCILDDIIAGTNHEINDMTYQLMHDTNNIQSYMKKVDTSQINESDKMAFYKIMIQLNSDSLVSQIKYMKNINVNRFKSNYDRVCINNVIKRYDKCMDNSVKNIKFNMYIYRNLEIIYPFMSEFIDNGLVMVCNDCNCKAWCDLMENVKQHGTPLKTFAIGINVRNCVQLEIRLRSVEENGIMNCHSRVERIINCINNNQTLNHVLCQMVGNKKVNNNKNINNIEIKSSKQIAQMVKTNNSFFTFIYSNKNSNSNNSNNSNNTNHNNKNNNNNNTQTLYFDYYNNNNCNNDIEDEGDEDDDMDTNNNSNNKNKKTQILYGDFNNNNVGGGDVDMKDNTPAKNKKRKRKQTNDDLSNDSNDNDNNSNNSYGNQPSSKRQKVSVVPKPGKWARQWLKRVGLYKRESKFMDYITKAVAGSNGLDTMAIDMENNNAKGWNLFSKQDPLCENAGYYLLSLYIQDSQELSEYNIKCFPKRTMQRIPPWNDCWIKTEKDKKVGKVGAGSWSFSFPKEENSNRMETRTANSFGMMCLVMGRKGNLFPCLYCFKYFGSIDKAKKCTCSTSKKK